MAYREPGVFVTVQNNRPSTGLTPALLPLIVGEGRKYVDFSGKAITRASSGDTDTLPSTTVTAITKVYTKASNGTETTISSSSYTLTVPNIITWGASAPDKPTAGTVYYVDYEARPEANDYEVKSVKSFDKLDEVYGGMFMKTASGGAKTALNPIYLGAYLALESGAAEVLAVQIKPAASDYSVADADWQTAIDNHIKYENRAYRIVPMTKDADIIGYFKSHVNFASTVEERMERTMFISKEIAATTKSTLITELTTYATGINNKRISFVFPNKATKVLSDGAVYTLGGEYICAALSGVDAVIPIERALTRQRLHNFLTVKTSNDAGTLTNVKFTRTELNELAAAGVMVLEQPAGAGTSVIVRHGVTTKMDNVADRENSVVKIADYVSKFLRDTLEAYIGVYNINSDTIARIEASLRSALDTLERNKIINGKKINLIAQDELNPDSLVVSVSILPPYPCNYIDLNLIIE